MKIPEAERQAILEVIKLGNEWEFGNLIAHLNTAWAKKLIKDGMSEEDAMKSTHGEGYPIKMHDDLVERGEWDETGKKYIKKAGPVHQ